MPARESYYDRNPNGEPQALLEAWCWNGFVHVKYGEVEELQARAEELAKDKLVKSIRIISEPRVVSGDKHARRYTLLYMNYAMLKAHREVLAKSLEVCEDTPVEATEPEEKP